MKLTKVAKREYLERVRKKSFLIGTILGPIIMTVLIVVPGLIFKLTPERQMKIAVIDTANSVYEEFEEALDDTLSNGGSVFMLRRVNVADGGLDNAKRGLNREVESDVIDGYIVLPADIVTDSSAVFYGKRVGDIRTLGRIEEALSRVAIGRRLSASGMDYDIVSTMLKGVDLETVQIRAGGEKKSEFSTVYLTNFVFVMMLYMTILLWGVAVQRSIIEEKNNRVIEVLLSSLRSFDLLAGKILGVAAVGLTQYAIWAFFGIAISVYALSSGHFAQFVNFTWISLLFFVVFYLLGFLFYSTLLAGIGSVCNTDQEAQQLQTPVVMCLLFTLIIPIAIVQSPDGLFATIVSMIPFFSPIVMFMRINILTPPTWQIALSIMILLLSIYAAALAAAKIFRVGILMYGKRPGLPEILKWLKRA